jgi:hypothetical protein
MEGRVEESAAHPAGFSRTPSSWIWLLTLRLVTRFGFFASDLFLLLSLAEEE